jgi:NADPH-dependent curcumin reductase
MTINRQILLISRPKGEPSMDNFALVESQLPTLQEGQVLVKHHFLSLDPYMRGRMNDGKNYAQPQPLNQVMIGGTVGVIEQSASPHFSVGDRVLGMGGWQQYAVVDANQKGALQKLGDSPITLSAFLGPVGMPGVTAWYGLNKIIQIKAGETLVVSAASGAVGSVVGQLAKAQGATVVGLAGGRTKCAYVTAQLGFDDCVDYKQFTDPNSLTQALKNVCPSGIDGYFENVGGAVLDAVMLNCNAFARIAMCGMISGYSGQPIPMQYPQLFLTQRMKLEGFIVSEHMEIWPQALKELGTLVASKKLIYRETIAQGIAAAPAAFLGLLKGENFGKQLVRLVD